MALVARGAGSGDIVNTGHPVCISPGQINTLSCSGDVFISGYGVHRKDDTNDPHTHCPPVYSTTINSYSPSVFANNLAVARLNDTYTCGAYVESIAQNTVYADS